MSRFLARQAAPTHLLFLTCIGLTACGEASVAPPVTVPIGAFVIDHVTVVDARGAQPERAVVIAEGRIHAVLSGGTIFAEGTEIVDGSGRYLVPGLADPHVHLTLSGATRWVGPALAENLRANLVSGVLAVMDVGGPTSLFDLRERIARGEILGPTVRATGPFLTVPGSHPCENYPYRECRFVDVRSARRIATGLIAEGADALKAALADAAFTPWPTPRLEPRALAQVTKIGVPVLVHIDTERDALDALDAGATILAHVPFDAPLSADAVTRLAKGARAIHTTLGAVGGVLRLLDDKVDYGVAELIVGPGVAANWQQIESNPQKLREGFIEGSRQWLAAAEHNLKALREAGAQLVAGTDAGYLFTPHGLGLHWELADLVALGWTPLEALTSATRDARALIGLEGGLVEAGAPADLLLLRADPLADITNLKAIDVVILRGKRWTQGALRSVDLYPGASPEGGVCLEANDCARGLRCDFLDHVCHRACRTTFWSITGCGPRGWCMPVDALVGSLEGVCRDEPRRCDPYQTDSCAYAGAGSAYTLSCQPLDHDTFACRAAGTAQPGETCSYDELGSSCAPGNFCSWLSSRCFRLCDPAAPDHCPEGSRCQAQEDGNGAIWFGLCL